MATGGNDSAQQYARVSDISNEPLEMHMPIRGFEKMELVSLEEAIQPLVPILPEIQDYAFVAKTRTKPIPDNGLSRDESASIILYSMEWEPHEECLYYALNGTLRSEDRRKLKPWFSYLKLILTALAQLPSFSRTVYRGVKLDLSKEYPEGKQFVWWGFSSCTSSIKVLENEQFLGTSGKRTMFAIECESGKDISSHSYYKSEKEILLIAARQFIVDSTLRPAPGLHIIQLKEINSPITLISTVKSDSCSKNTSSNATSIKQSTPNPTPKPSKPVHPQAADYDLPKQIAKPNSQEFSTPGTYGELHGAYSSISIPSNLYGIVY